MSLARALLIIGPRGFSSSTGRSVSGRVHLVCFRDGRAAFVRGVTGQQIDTVVGPITIR